MFVLTAFNASFELFRRQVNSLKLFSLSIDLFTIPIVLYRVGRAESGIEFYFISLSRMEASYVLVFWQSIQVKVALQKKIANSTRFRFLSDEV